MWFFFIWQREIEIISVGQEGIFQIFLVCLMGKGVCEKHWSNWWLGRSKEKKKKGKKKCVDDDEINLTKINKREKEDTLKL